MIHFHEQVAANMAAYEGITYPTQAIFEPFHGLFDVPRGLLVLLEDCHAHGGARLAGPTWAWSRYDVIGWAHALGAERGEPGEGEALGVPLRVGRLYGYAWTDCRVWLDASVLADPEAHASALAALIGMEADFYALTPADRSVIASACDVGEVDVSTTGAADYWDACGPAYLGAFERRWSTRRWLFDEPTQAVQSVVNEITERGLAVPRRNLKTIRPSWVPRSTVDD